MFEIFSYNINIILIVIAIMMVCIMVCVQKVHGLKAPIAIMTLTSVCFKYYIIILYYSHIFVFEKEF